ncbi:NAD(P)H-binding protein [Conexibacter woesei]|uniref:NmrA family protein n=1 Tax=Conexibacter woesei (strain DSM 14684 / CCUG 47730 / CIP 108061 / JCM 11494 / NBRC 100937 / ID131577) TaxID=469383 RepID=D3EZW7_CONWI|nr:NAD(P)H-binding protein [Conexibacter woesei]ADB49943.1 NmrA family protein [Conexibacter woesei DSM 14684]
MSDYLIIGGSGKTGRRIVEHLTAAGHTARAASRGGAVHFDWHDETTWDAALAGTEGVYLVVPQQGFEYAAPFAALLKRAEAAGVRRAVMLSARGAEFVPGNPVFAAEDVVRGSGLDWTILRPTWFDQNFTEAYFAPGEDGAVVAPAGDGREPFVDLDDVAAVAAAALTDPRHAGRTYELSGPEALTFGELVALLAAEAGRELRYVAADPADYERILTGALDAERAAFLAQLFAAIRDGRDTRLSDGVQQALGRPATTVAQWAAREGAALRAEAVAPSD